MSVSKLRYIGIYWFLPLLYLLPILSLMEFQYKTVFFTLIYVLTTLLLHYSQYDKVSSWKLEYKLTSQIYVLIDVLLILVSIFLFINKNIYHIGNVYVLYTSLIGITFLFGNSVYRMLKLYHKDILVETIFSFILAFFLISIQVLFYNAFLRLNQWSNLILIIMLSIGLYNIVAKKKYQHRFITINCNSLLLILCFIFFISSINIVFPNYALLPGPDIARFWAAARNIIRIPEYGGVYLPYVFFNCYSGFIQYFSNSNIMEHQTILVLLNFMPVFSFFVMINSYLKNHDEKTPFYTTLIYFFISGIGWVWIVYRKFYSNQAQPWILFDSITPTFNDINGAGGLWISGFKPIYLSLSFFYVILYLLNESDLEGSINRKSLLFSITFLSCFLTHTAEAVFLILLLSSYHYFTKNEDNKLKRYLVLLGQNMLIVLVLYLITPIFTNIEVSWGTYNLHNRMLLQAVIFPMIVLSTAIFLPAIKFPRRLLANIHQFINRFFNAGGKYKLSIDLLTTYLKIDFKINSFQICSLLIFILSIILWILNISKSYRLYPMYYYPIKLGIKYILGMMGLNFIIKNKTHKEFSIFIMILLTSLFINIGLLISPFTILSEFVYDQVNRLINYISISITILSGLYLNRLLHTFKKHSFIQSQIIMFIILMSTLSTLYHVEYSFYDSRTRITDLEYEAVLFLDERLVEDPITVVFTLSKYAYEVTSLAGSHFKVYNPLLLEFDEPFMEYYLSGNSTFFEVSSYPNTQIEHNLLIIYYFERQKISENAFLNDFMAENSPIFENRYLKIFEIMGT